MDLRDIFLFAALVTICLASLRRPQIGLLGWIWISLMNPHKLAFGFITSMPLLDILFVFTGLGCLIRWKERKSADYHPLLKVLVAFYVWCTLTTIFSVDFLLSWHDWLNFTKTLLAVFLILQFMAKRHWIIASFAVYILALGFSGFKGGFFTVITGGAHHVLGPPGTYWGDNNGVSMAMLMAFPIALGFAGVFNRKIYRMGAYLLAATCVISVFGTQSRGGLVGLVAVCGATILRSRRKFLALMLAPAILAGAFFFMPQTWIDRMYTMANPEEAGGSRLIQWEYAIDISLERPFFGSGFDCFFHQPYYYRYVAHKDKNRAVHSSYFQVLAEQGYIGLAMYLSMLVMMLHVSRKYSLLGKGREDLRWATSLMGMTQFSVIGYAANGLTLNMA
jgi:probable O-glycosylation ligase (exosortase A-associated)